MVHTWATDGDIWEWFLNPVEKSIPKRLLTGRENTFVIGQERSLQYFFSDLHLVLRNNLWVIYYYCYHCILTNKNYLISISNNESWSFGNNTQIGGSQI